MLAGSEDPLRLAYLLASMFSLDLRKSRRCSKPKPRRARSGLMHAYLSQRGAGARAPQQDRHHARRPR